MLRLLVRFLVAAAAIALVAVSLHHSAQLRIRFREEADITGGNRPPAPRRGTRATIKEVATLTPGLETYPFDDDSVENVETAGGPLRVGDIFHDPAARDEEAFLRHPEGQLPLHEFVDGHAHSTLHHTDGELITETEDDDGAGPAPDNTTSAQELSEPGANSTADNSTAADALLDSGNRPLLEDLIERINGSTASIQGDVQFLLDFAVIGFPHTGAGHLAHWLSSQGVAMPRRHLEARHATALVEGLYPQWSSATNASHRRIGYYNPYDIHYTASLRTLKRHFPRTKLVVGVRHPVLWFQDWYNGLHRAAGRNSSMLESPLPPPEHWVGPRLPALTRCHVPLSLLGKTAHDGRARQLLETPYALWAQRIQALRADDNGGDARLPNPVFLFEARQVQEPDPRRLETFYRDLAKFLELEGDPQMANISNSIPAEEADDETFNICHEQYRDLRSELMEISMKASVWLIYYFLRSPDVTVSSSHDMMQLLNDWFSDPCASVAAS